MRYLATTYYNSIFSLYLHKTAIYFEIYPADIFRVLRGWYERNFYLCDVEPTDFLSDVEYESKKILSLFLVEIFESLFSFCFVNTASKSCRPALRNAIPIWH